MKIRIGQVGISGYGVIHFEQVMRLVESGRADFCAAAVINPDQVPGQLAALKRPRKPCSRLSGENWILSAFRLE